MKKIVLLSLVLALALLLSACSCKHEQWNDATCTTPKTCAKCGETEGEPLGHKWVEATCKAPKTCSVCGKTEGDVADHKWIDATCDTPKTCSICGKTEGDALGHNWEDATCTKPKTCSVCGKTEGDALGHKWVDATFTAPKTCSVCGETEGEKLSYNPKIPEKYHYASGKWLVGRMGDMNDSYKYYGKFSDNLAGYRIPSCAVTVDEGFYNITFCFEVGEPANYLHESVTKQAANYINGLGMFTVAVDDFTLEDKDGSLLLTTIQDSNYVFILFNTQDENLATVLVTNGSDEVYCAFYKEPDASALMTTELEKLRGEWTSDNDILFNIDGNIVQGDATLSCESLDNMKIELFYKGESIGNYELPVVDLRFGNLLVAERSGYVSDKKYGFTVFYDKEDDELTVSLYGENSHLRSVFTGTFTRKKK